MQQTLFLIPHQLGPLPVFGFGWALIAWGAACLVMLAWLIRRQGFSADTAGYLPVMLLAAAALVYVAPMMEIRERGETTGLPIRGYGVMMLIGVVSGVGLAAYRTRRMGLDPELIFSMAFVMFLAGIVGARLFFIIEYRDQYLRDPWQILNVTQGGLVVYGSVLGGLPAGVIFLRRRGFGFRKILAVGDIIAPSMLIGLAFGRIGCLMNGCCFGGVCEQDWTPQMQFPRRAAYAQQDSPPYAHQHTLGQLHGFRLAADEQGRAIVAEIYENAGEPLRQSLHVGDVVARIQFTPRSAARLANRVSLLVGSTIEVEKRNGELVEIPVRQAQTESGGQVGFDLRRTSDGFVVSQLTLGGPADMTGKLSLGDVVRDVSLPSLEQIAATFDPPLTPADVAEALLALTGPQFTIVTDDGRSVDVSLDALPDWSRPVHPTQIYSAINGFLLCFFLWVYYPFRRRDGDVFAVMLIVYPIARFLLELIRSDEPSQFGTALTISQLVSIAIFFTGVVMLIYLSRQPPGSVLPEDKKAA